MGRARARGPTKLGTQDNNWTTVVECSRDGQERTAQNILVIVNCLIFARHLRFGD
jgi:hypothetical protein